MGLSEHFRSRVTIGVAALMTLATALPIAAAQTKQAIAATIPDSLVAREVRTVGASDLGVSRPSDVVYDATQRRFRVTGQVGGATAAVKMDRTWDPTKASPVGDAEGPVLPPRAANKLTAINPADGLTYRLVQGAGRLEASDSGGDMVAVYDTSTLDLGTAAAITFAPSTDFTDDPAAQNLFIADSGRGRWEGGVTEVTLHQSVAVAAADVSATLIQSVDTSVWQPPSTDPSGIVWNSNIDELIIVDSEVNETTLFDDVNLWKMSRAGTLVGTGGTHGPATANYSDEPTGVGYDPATNTMFITDDTGTNSVYVVDAGSDALFGTPDDVATSIDVDALASDPEDPTFHVGQGVLYFLSGVDMEIFRLDPVDGVFANGNDVITSFDISHLGPTDFEGLTAAPNRGTLYVAARTKTTTTPKTFSIFEITSDGSLIRTIEVPISEMTYISGLGMAPSSTDPSVPSLWLADRAVDEVNDGLLFEIAVPSLDDPATNNTPPVANDDPASTDQDMPVNIDVLANDTDTDSDPLEVANLSTPANGTAVIEADETVTYTPNPGHKGMDTFTYQADDGLVLSNVATVTVAVNDTTPPAPPSGVSANPGDGQVVLDWDDNTEPDLATYAVYRSTTTGGPYTQLASELTTSNHVDSTTTNSTTYYYVVAAVDTSNNQSANSTEVSATPTGPPPPSGAIDFTGYTIQPYGAGQDAGTASVSDGGATLELNGNAWKKIAFNYPVTPDTVIEFDFSSTSRGEIHGIGFDTDDSISANRTFRIYGTQNWGIPITPTYPGSGVTHYVIPVGQFYTGSFEFLTFTNDHDVANPTAHSRYSNVTIHEGTAPPPDTTPPAAPLGLIATPGDSQVGLDWTDSPEPDAASYRVFRSTTSGGPYALIATGLNSSAHTDTTVTNNTEYFYVVTAVDTTGNESANSAEVSATPTGPPPPSGAIDFTGYTIQPYGAGQDAGTASVSDGGATLELNGNAWKKIAFNYPVTPDTVIEFDFTSTSRGEIHGIGFDTDDSISSNRTFRLYGTQNWGIPITPTYPGSGVTHYVIPVGQFYTGSFEFLTFTNDHDVANPTAHSRYSNVTIHEGTAPPPDTTPPAAPLGLIATPGDSQVGLDWTDSPEPDAASYRVFRSTTSGGPYALIATGLNSSAHTDTTVTNNTEYFYVVTAVDTTGNESANSAEVSATPTGPPPPSGAIDFTGYTIQPYGAGQDAGTASVSDGGATLELNGNAWKKIAFNYPVTPDTVIEFDFTSTNRGEIHGIGFDTDDSISANRTFRLYGTQNWGIPITPTYPGTGVTHYVIPVGQFYTGSFEFLTFTNDHDVANPTAHSRYTNVTIHEGQ